MNPGDYHRCDKSEPHRCWATRPGKYGLYVETPARYRHGDRPPTFRMITSADSVRPLLHYRTYLKPYLLAYIAKATREIR